MFLLLEIEPQPQPQPLEDGPMRALYLPQDTPEIRPTLAAILGFWFKINTYIQYPTYCATLAPAQFIITDGSWEHTHSSDHVV